MNTSRRQFIRGSVAFSSVTLLTTASSRSQAEKFSWPAGLQLYTVMEALQKDFEGTLQQVRAIGYREVEMAGFFGKKPAEVRIALRNSGLHCGSVFIFGGLSLEETAEYATTIGAKYIVTSILPPKRFPSKKMTRADHQALTLDDYKDVAEQCNRMGEQAKRAGLQLVYHNHNFEFKPLPGRTGYDELLKSTDTDLVKLELDCGWISAAGVSAASYISKYPDRCRMLHLKDFRLASEPSYSTAIGERPEPTELGRGNIDYKPILEAADKAAVEWCYVEQEPPFHEMPALEAIKVSYNYLRTLQRVAAGDSPSPASLP
jgi:sugar phosphate isomerase/epimerase